MYNLKLRLSHYLLFSCLFFVSACSSSSGQLKDSNEPPTPPEDTQQPLDAYLPQDSISSDSSIDTESDRISDTFIPPTSFTATPVQTITITEVTSGHLAFPDITPLSDGGFMVVYRKGAGHVEASGKIMQQIGSADAQEWTEPVVLHDTPGIDDRDPSIVTLSDGTLAVIYFQYATKTVDGAQLALHQIFYGASTDNGITFGDFTQVSVGPMAHGGAQLDGQQGWLDAQNNPLMVSACSSAPVELDGTITIPAYGGQALNIGNLPGSLRSRLSLFAKSDGGENWSETIVNPTEAQDIWLMEPALIRLSNGKMLMHVRTAAADSPGSPGKMYQTESSDGGATWSPYTAFGFIGHAPELVQLSNGVVLSAFRWINNAYTNEQVGFVYSLDSGTTWSEVAFIEDCGAVECGYPGIVELDNRRILFVYYSAGGKSIKGKIYESRSALLSAIEKLLGACYDISTIRINYI